MGHYFGVNSFYTNTLDNNCSNSVFRDEEPDVLFNKKTGYPLARALESGGKRTTIVNLLNFLRFRMAQLQ